MSDISLNTGSDGNPKILLIDPSQSNPSPVQFPSLLATWSRHVSRTDFVNFGLECVRSRLESFVSRLCMSYLFMKSSKKKQV